MKYEITRRKLCAYSFCALMYLSMPAFANSVGKEKIDAAYEVFDKLMSVTASSEITDPEQKAVIEKDEARKIICKYADENGDSDGQTTSDEIRNTLNTFDKPEVRNRIADKYVGDIDRFFAIYSRHMDPKNKELPRYSGLEVYIEMINKYSLPGGSDLPSVCDIGM